MKRTAAALALAAALMSSPAYAGDGGSTPRPGYERFTRADTGVTYQVWVAPGRRIPDELMQTVFSPLADNMAGQAGEWFWSPARKIQWSHPEWIGGRSWRQQ